MIRSLLRWKAIVGPSAAAMVVGLVWLGCGQDRNDVTAPADLRLQELAPAINVAARHTDRLLAIPGVVGTAVGLTADGQPAVKIFTREAGVAGLPESLEGVPVAVEVTGMIVALSALADPTARFSRPVPIGVSTGHPDITAGTIGARVKNTAGDVFALSNNHVYAVINDANMGDIVLQPGTFDGGQDPEDEIGTLFDFQEIDFDGGDNLIDAAIARSSTADLGNSTPPGGYGTPSSPNPTTVSAPLGQVVKKYGRTTGFTQASVTDVNVTINVCYECKGPLCLRCRKLARFVNQLGIASPSFSSGGDSGSLIVDAGNNAFALLFAGSSTHTFCNPIGPVLSRFNVTIDGGATAPPTPVTDVAVTSVSAPASLVQGDAAVTVEFTVQNVGNQDVTSDINVTLVSDNATPVNAGDDITIGARTITGGLTAGASTTTTFAWNTTGANTGDHTLTASHNFADDDLDNNSRNSVLVTVELAVTDIAITAVSALSPVVLGDPLDVSVTVDNVGNQHVITGINVTLVSDNATPLDLADDITIGAQIITGGLVAGGSANRTFTWETSAASTGDHTLTASHSFTDDVAANNSGFTTATVNEPTAGPSVTLCSPASGNPGDRFTVTVDGSNFQNGATASFGQQVQVRDVSVVSATQLDVEIRINKRAPPGSRAVTVTNPDGQNGTRTACFAVNLN